MQWTSFKYLVSHKLGGSLSLSNASLEKKKYNRSMTKQYHHANRVCSRTRNFTKEIDFTVYV